MFYLESGLPQQLLLKAVSWLRAWAAPCLDPALSGFPAGGNQASTVTALCLSVLVCKMALQSRPLMFTDPGHGSRDLHAAAAAAAKSLQSCLTLCDLIDGSSPGSAVPGILQARTLEWVTISFSNDATLQSISEPIDMCGPHYSLFMFVFMIATTKNVLIGNARPFFFMFLYKRGFSLP